MSYSREGYPRSFAGLEGNVERNVLRRGIAGPQARFEEGVRAFTGLLSLIERAVDARRAGGDVPVSGRKTTGRIHRHDQRHALVVQKLARDRRWTKGCSGDSTTPEGDCDYDGEQAKLHR
jgi:hypothetical protein